MIRRFAALAPRAALRKSIAPVQISSLYRGFRFSSSRSKAETKLNSSKAAAEAPKQKRLPTRGVCVLSVLLLPL